MAHVVFLTVVKLDFVLNVTAVLGIGAAFAARWFRHAARRSPGCFPFAPTVIPCPLWVHSVEMGAYRSGKDAESRTTRAFGSAFDVRRQLHERLSVTVGPLQLSCFLPCQIPSASNQQPERSFLYQMPPKVARDWSKPHSRPASVCVSATLLGADVIAHATTANRRGEMTVIRAALHHLHHTNCQTSSIRTYPWHILIMCWRMCYGLQRRWRGSRG